MKSRPRIVFILNYQSEKTRTWHRETVYYPIPQICFPDLYQPRTAFELAMWTAVDMFRSGRAKTVIISIIREHWKMTKAFFRSLEDNDRHGHGNLIAEMITKQWTFERK